MISEEFREVLSSNDVVLVRSSLLDYLIADTSYKKFDEALEEAKKVFGNILFQNYNNDPFLEESQWDMSYLNKQKSYLMSNFCVERIVHIKEVIPRVIPAKKQTVKTGVTTKEYVISSNSSSNTRNTNNKTGKYVIENEIAGTEEIINDECEEEDPTFNWKGSVILAGVGITVGGIVFHSVAGAVITGAALGIGGALVLNKKK